MADPLVSQLGPAGAAADTRCHRQRQRNVDPRPTERVRSSPCAPGALHARQVLGGYGGHQHR
eukprot:523748-Prymnesium_polylepis.2